MNFFRRLIADVPAELLAAQIATTGRTPEALTATHTGAPAYGDLFATLAALEVNPGVLTPQTPGMPVPARHEGEPQ